MTKQPHRQEIETLQHKIKQADALAEMKSNFLATMSHEIRTPMQSVYGLLELIREEDDINQIRAMAKIAQNSASGLLEILDDILDFAKMDADKMELDILEVPVRMLVRGTLEALSVNVHGDDVEIIDDIAQDVPFVVIGDPKRLRQIIMNLCSNAIKFTRKGSVTVSVSRSVQHIKEPKNGLALRFEVIDTGIGMSKDVCDSLFQSFVQADKTTQRKYGGTGLGLSIAKKLVELMDGKIGVDSAEGKGSTFWFEIPTSEVDIDENTVEMPNLEGISVISVENHPQGAKEILKSLQSMGASVESCPTYYDGLELMKRRPFDVAVIDQGLPDGLGLDLMREVSDLRPNMGLVMYTVRDDPGLRHSLNAMGAAYVTKPASRAGLGEAVLSAAPKTGQKLLTGSRRILIAEDTDSVRYTLEQQLGKLGAEFDFAENGEIALTMLSENDYGLLITDLHMPELDGYGLIKAIREKEMGDDHLPVMIMSADVQMAQRQAYIEHGFDESLLKPVSIGRLRGLLTRWGVLEQTEAEDAKTKEIAASKTEKLQNGAIDFSMIEEQFGAFDNSSIEMLGMFVEMTEPLIQKILEAHNQNDINALTEHAHSLKGAALSACCTILGNLADRLQESCENGAYNPALINQIKEAFEDVKTEIKAL